MQQRRIETAVRRQKDVSIAARAAGDTKLRHDAQRTINALMDRYDKIADAAGVDTQYSRMRVNGFKALGKRELQKAENSGTIRAYSEMLSDRKTVARTKDVRSLSLSGEPDSITDFVDETGNVIIQRRVYDHSGKAFVDFDTSDHKRPKLHPTGAHKHTFDYSKKKVRNGYIPLTEKELEENKDIIRKGVNYNDAK